MIILWCEVNPYFPQSNASAFSNTVFTTTLQNKTTTKNKDQLYLYLVAQSCLTLWPSVPVHGILQARILEWVVIPSPPGDLPNPGIEPRSPAWQVDSLPAELPGKPQLSLYHLKVLSHRVSIIYWLIYTCNILGNFGVQRPGRSNPIQDRKVYTTGSRAD